MLKSLAENPNISDLHVLGFRFFDIFFSNGAFLDCLLIYALLSQNLLSRLTHFFRRIFETGKHNVPTLSLMLVPMMMNLTTMMMNLASMMMTMMSLAGMWTALYVSRELTQW